MNKPYINWIAILFFVCAFYTSCTNNTNDVGNLKFDHILINKTGHLFSDTAKPGANIVIDFEYITKASDNKLKDSLNALFQAVCFGDKYIDENIIENVNAYIQNYLEEYRQDLEPMFLEDQKNKENGGSIDSWYSYYKGIESHVQFYKKDLLVYRVDYNEYTGGAHGTYMSTFLNFDLKNTYQLGLNDIFTGDYKEPLTDLLWKQLMADNQVTTRAELEDLGYGLTGDLVPTENFYLNEKGITFHYNIYEFTPYAMGAVEIMLPYTAIEHILSSESIISWLKKQS